MKPGGTWSRLGLQGLPQGYTRGLKVTKAWYAKKRNPKVHWGLLRRFKVLEPEKWEAIKRRAGEWFESKATRLPETSPLVLQERKRKAKREAEADKWIEEVKARKKPVGVKVQTGLPKGRKW